jgi:hypothetical protein
MIILKNPENLKAWGHMASLFADTKAEIQAEDEVVNTGNCGVVTCLAGSSCITLAGEVLQLGSNGTWTEMV